MKLLGAFKINNFVVTQTYFF